MFSMRDCIHVGLSDIKIAEPNVSIRAAGLGSCVGVVIYDQVTKTAGMAHIMLPDSALSKNKTFPPGKYADTALAALLKKLKAYDVNENRLYAKLAGGAEMFRYTEKVSIGKVGPRNVEAVKKELYRLSIPVVSEDTGGHYGRTIEFYTRTLMLHVKTIYRGEKMI
ncbi:chemotaxis protein CheD [Scopulibacillus cellulosilyticus]|uniref:Probable chemoreceptor glutamine deamidase CheD n=1 Tax=Scopulibacillus cellulosilyticus TaxID=2665665 RepID=A0ABW2PV75_9BACL